MAKRPAGGARLTRRFEQALVYATRAHHKQKRKGTRIPYVGHLLGVAALVLEDGGSQDQAIAALLHDAVEDQGGKARLADIRARFGREVARIVAACSDSETDDPSEKRPWPERKQDYLDHLRRAPASALRVSAADKLYNARAILADYRALGEGLWRRFNREAGRATSCGTTARSSRSSASALPDR